MVRHSTFCTSAAFFSAWFASVYCAQPIQLAWSRKTYGPDGPWNAVNVNINGTSVDLAPGGYYQNWIFSENYCKNSTLFANHPCDSIGAGLVPEPSSTLSIPGFIPTAVWASGLPQAGGLSAIYGFPLKIPIPNGPTIPYVATNLIESTWLTLPDGTTYPQTLGALALGGPALSWSFDGQHNYTMIPSYMYSQDITSSASVGIHIGSASLGIPGSMIWGGYDRSRVLGDVLVQTQGISGSTPAITGVGLLDIAIGTATGGSPFNFTTKSGLMTQGNSSMPNALTVEFFTDSPYLFLPKSTCDAIASYLPVTFQEKYGLYFWDVQDPSYQRIVNSASFLSFTFEADNLASRNLTIKVPWSLLNLTLSEPIVDKPTTYFPCRPSGPTLAGTQILGQAFMQAAYLAIDWKPFAPPGKFFLAQAPGPGLAAVPDTVNIHDGDVAISSSPVKWEDTWNGHWLPLSDGSNSPASPTPSMPMNSAAPAQTGLSTGAQAGIGVGVSVVGVAAIGGALFFFLRRRRANAPAARAVSPDRFFQEEQRELPAQPPAYTKKEAEPIQELHHTPAGEGSPRVYELYEEPHIGGTGAAR